MSRKHVFSDSIPVIDWLEEHHPEIHKKLTELGVEVAKECFSPEKEEYEDLMWNKLNDAVKEVLALYRSEKGIVVMEGLDDSATGPRAHLVRSYYYPPYFGFDMSGKPTREN